MHATAVSGSGPLHPIPHVSGDSPPLLQRFLSSTLVRGVTCRPPVRRVSFAFFFFFSYIHLFFQKKQKTFRGLSDRLPHDAVFVAHK